MDLYLLMSRHGYALIFGLLLAEAVGLPFPAAIALVAAGAASGAHALWAPYALVVALVALLFGDSVQFFLGRYMGWALLGFLCRVSINPETCILRSAESFYKRGKITLVIAKFIPGINTMAAPLAGSMKMRLGDFLQFDTIGAAFYVGAYSLAGYHFSDALRAITRGLRSAGFAAEVVFAVGLAAYVIYRIWIYRKYRLLDVIPRVQAEELAKRLTSDAAHNMLIADVRSHGYYDADSERIAGSIRIEPNNLIEEVKHLPKDREIYLYCT